MIPTQVTLFRRRKKQEKRIRNTMVGVIGDSRRFRATCVRFEELPNAMIIRQCVLNSVFEPVFDPAFDSAGDNVFQSVLVPVSTKAVSSYMS